MWEDSFIQNVQTHIVSNACDGRGIMLSLSATCVYVCVCAYVCVAQESSPLSPSKPPRW